MSGHLGLVRPRYCGEPAPGGRRCQDHLAPWYNPLGFCVAHLAAYRARIASPTPIGATAPAVVLDFGDPSRRPIAVMCEFT